jgi:ABC-type sugar transport system ATPase subunit
LAQHGPPDLIYRQPASLAVARFFGGVNFLPGTAKAGVFQTSIGPLPLPEGLPTALTHGPGLLTIRPEAIGLAAPGHPGTLAAQVQACTFLGTQSRVDLDLSGTLLQALVAPEYARSLTQGQSLGVILPPAALWVVPDHA